MLEVLSAVAYTRAVQGGGLLGRFARARAPMNDCLAQSVSWTGHVHANRFCNYVFRARARTKSARMSAPQWEWYLTCVQHVWAVRPLFVEKKHYSTILAPQVELDGSK